MAVFIAKELLQIGDSGKKKKPNPPPFWLGGYSFGFIFDELGISCNIMWITTVNYKLLFHFFLKKKDKDGLHFV